MPSARKAAVTASPMAGSSLANKVRRAGTVTSLPKRANACASSSATTEAPITASRLGMASLTRASVDVQYGVPRSEEHTSELQSLMRISYAVFCLKKKKNESQQENYTKA